MGDPFAGKKYLVTGGASGIGLATAVALRRRGARLAIWDVHAPPLEAACKSLKAFPAWVDVTRHALAPAMQQVVDELGGLDGVVHCAGLASAGMFGSHPPQQDAPAVEVYLSGTVAVAHAALPFLRQVDGVLVLLAAVPALDGSSGEASYAAAKAGVLHVAQALRVELSGTGVYVGVVTPNRANPSLPDEERHRSTRPTHGEPPPLEASHPELIAGAILRGIAQRRLMIYPTWQARAIHLLSRCKAWRGTASRVK